MTQKQKVYIIVGPTASGKSAYAVRLAKEVGGEIISADSRQVYVGMNKGTGKVTKKEMAGIPHHLLDVVSPKKVFTVDNYVAHAQRALTDIIRRGKVPIIAGGTGFYIDALFGKHSYPAVPQNKKLRAALSQKSAPELFALLSQRDPARAQTIDPHNPVRLIRALEIIDTLGHVPPQKKTNPPYDIEWVGLKPQMNTLRQKIHVRLDARMKSGMLAEARALHAAGVSYKRMKELGLEYRYLALYLEGSLTKEAMLIELETKIYQYAKRQMTYWKKNKEIRWVKI